MIAYNTQWLYNKYVQEQAESAFREKSITNASYKKTLAAHENKLYTPHFIISIGLVFLTIITIGCSGGLLGLIVESFRWFTSYCIFMALACYTALELFVRKQYFYNAGVDNVLQCAFLSYLGAAFFVNDFDNQYIFAAFVLLLASAWMAIRFTDAFMALLAWCNLFVFGFLLYIKFGEIAKATAPFVMMLASLAAYLFIRKIAAKKSLLLYRKCLNVLIVASLVTLYLSVNYFVVKELSTTMFNLPQGSPLPFSYLFIVLTILIPVVYILIGIIKKDLLLIRTGLVLVIVSVCTIRYYFTLAPIEWMLAMGGIILISISYALLQYLKVSKHGFSIVEDSPSKEDLLKLESLIIAETFGNTTIAKSPPTSFGGGSSGGGGATGNY